MRWRSRCASCSSCVLAWIVARVLRRSVTRAAQRLRDQPRASAFFDSTTDPGVLDDLARRRHAQRVDTFATVLRSVVGVLVWAVAVLIVLADLGVDLAPLLASAGVATVVIGFGAQQVVRDYLAGLSMLLEDQFGVGDVVDMGEASGTVESVSLRVTRLRDVEGVVWWVPNGQVTRVGNKSQQWSRALLDIAVAPDTEIDRATQIIKRTADEMWRDVEWRDRMLDEPEVWGVEDIGVGGILIRLVVKTVPARAVERLPRAAGAPEGRVRCRGCPAAGAAAADHLRDGWLATTTGAAGATGDGDGA